MRYVRFTILLLGLLVSVALTATTLPAPLRYLQAGQTSPAANLSQIAWLAGHWRGEGLGGEVEEIWSPPFAGSMMGAFKLAKQGKTQFYEIEIIRQVEATLLMQLKHFSADLTGWEEKAQTVDFPLVAIEENAVYFDGLSFIKQGENGLAVWVAMQQKDGTKKAIAFHYQRIISP